MTPNKKSGKATGKTSKDRYSSSNKSKKGMFKNKGAGILKSQPQSMSELLRDNDGDGEHNLTEPDQTKQADNKTDKALHTTDNVPGLDTDIAQMLTSANAQLHKSANAQRPTSTNAQPPNPENPSEETERFHIHIRIDLADKIHDEVRKRKRSRNGKSPTRRAIIEDALEKFFDN